MRLRNCDETAVDDKSMLSLGAKVPEEEEDEEEERERSAIFRAPGPLNASICDAERETEAGVSSSVAGPPPSFDNIIVAPVSNNKLLLLSGL